MLSIIESEIKSTKEGRVLTAQDVAGSLKILSKFQVDLIVCDYELPDGKADHVLDFMKKNQINTPVIVFTSRFDLSMPEDSRLLHIIRNKDFEELFRVVRGV